MNSIFYYFQKLRPLKFRGHPMLHVFMSTDYLLGLATVGCRYYAKVYWKLHVYAS